MHIGPQGGMLKVWVHAWERRFHGRILRCPESEVNALAGPCNIPSYMALADTDHQCAVAFLPRYYFGDIFCITSSRLKLAGFCRIGNSLKLASHCPTTACDGTMRNARSIIHLSYSSDASPCSNGSARRL